jgi:hypothetical protein
MIDETKIMYSIEYSGTKERQFLPSFAKSTIVKHCKELNGFKINQSEARMNAEKVQEIKIKIDENFNLILNRRYKT